MAKKRVSKRDLKVVRQCLDAGLSLALEGPRGTRHFHRGHITDRIDRGAVRTTHKNERLTGYVWLTGTAIALLAEQARTKLARKDELLAERDARVASMVGR